MSVGERLLAIFLMLVGVNTLAYVNSSIAQILSIRNSKSSRAVSCDSIADFRCNELLQRTDKSSQRRNSWLAHIPCA